MELKCWGRLADSPFVGFASRREVENDFEQTWRVVMKSIGGLIVGSMAGVVVGGGGDGGDFSLKGKKGGEGRGCSLYWGGFLYIPGADTPIKFGGADFQFDTLGAATVNPAVLSSSFNSTLLYTPGGGYVAVEYVLIQFEGFTFGKSASAFATPWQGYPGNNSSFLLGGHDSVTGVNNVQYTAEFGSGVTGTIGLNDPTVYNRTSIFD